MKKEIGKLPMSEYTILIEQDEEGFFTADVVELPGCFIQAKSQDQLLDRIKEAIELYLESMEDTVQKSHFIGIQRVVV